MSKRTPLKLLLALLLVWKAAGRKLQGVVESKGHEVREDHEDRENYKNCQNELSIGKRLRNITN